MVREDCAPGCARVSVCPVSRGPADLCSVLSPRMSGCQAHSPVSAFLQSKGQVCLLSSVKKTVSASGAKGMQAYCPL